jgi:adenylosuccinate synthase
MANRPVIVVQGGQWGSEGKGAVAAHLCIEREVDYAVRTGAINAGHTVMYKGEKFAMQQLPTGWVNPNTALVIGPGAYIHPPTLAREIEMINKAMPDQDVRHRLYIDSRCGVHTEEAEAASKEANRHHSIGATGKGCSEAIVAKIRNRNAGYKLFLDHPDAKALHEFLTFGDTVRLLNQAIDNDSLVLIEGTQGTFLDLHIGPYPFTTSRMTSAANWIAEAGLSPALTYEIVLVCRTFPIRVAGNSGPMSNEIEWTDLAEEVNAKLSVAGQAPRISLVAITEFKSRLEQAASRARSEGLYKVPTEDGIFRVRLSEWSPAERSQYRVAASELHRDALGMCSEYTVRELKQLFEMTTVTKKMRRLARIDTDDLRMAVMINRPQWICLTFMDYIEPMLAGVTEFQMSHASDFPELIPELMLSAGQYIRDLEDALGIPVKMITTGPAPNNCISTGWVRAHGSGR